MLCDSKFVVVLLFVTGVDGALPTCNIYMYMLSVCRLLPIYLLFSCSFTCFFFIFITFTCGQSSPLEKKKNNITSRISLFSCFYTWSPIIRLISPNGIPGLSLIRRFRDSLANTRYPQGARADDPRRLFFYWIKKRILLNKNSCLRKLTYSSGVISVWCWWWIKTIVIINNIITTVGRVKVQMIRLMLISIDVTGMIAVGLIIHVHKRAIVDQFERTTRSILNNWICQINFL